MPGLSQVALGVREVSKCATKRCRGVCLKSGRSPICSKCRARRWRERYPVNYFFAKLKYRAKERGHAFSLTREQFAALWQQKGLNGGKTAGSFSFDRIENAKGYEDGNVQILTLAENSRKRFVPFWSSQEREAMSSPKFVAQYVRETEEQIKAARLAASAT